MNRINQFVFLISFLLLCWFGMQAVHELGHVVGALVSGGEIQKVVLNPLSISQTEVFPNPHPLAVVWLGPALGCLMPWLFTWVIPREPKIAKKLAEFFAGFCLVANGAYIGFGAFNGIGDCGVMLEAGTPFWILPLFGITTFFSGIYLWHQLGSATDFLKDPTIIAFSTTYMVLGVLLLMMICQYFFFPA